MVILLVLLLSVPSLFWFGRNWRISVDGSEYLLWAWNLASGRGYYAFGDVPQTVRGPMYPGLLGLFMLLVGREPETLAWIIRALAVLNPILMYLVLRRVAGLLTGVLAAALTSLFAYTATLSQALNIDAVALTVYLLSVLVLLRAVETEGTGWAVLSGMLFGAAVLTKETLIVGLPGGLLAALFAGWSTRALMAHYLGVLVVSAPWWLWVWQTTDQIYLLGRLPWGPALLAVAVLGFAAVVMVAMRSSVRKRLSGIHPAVAGWTMLLLWIVLMSGLFVSTAGLNPGGDDDLRQYLREQVFRDTPLWYLLPAGLIYLCLVALRSGGLWALYLSLLGMQLPVLLLVLIQRYSVRQFTIPQALTYGALAALLAATVRGACSLRGGLRYLSLLGAVLMFGVVAMVGAGHLRSLWAEDERVA